MFAVKGWSVSADTLKTETAKPEPDTTSQHESKKRKRKGPEVSEDVTTSNVADMWERMIERKEAKGQKQPREQKRQKADNGQDSASLAKRGPTDKSQGKPRGKGEVGEAGDSHHESKKRKKPKQKKEKPIQNGTSQGATGGKGDGPQKAPKEAPEKALIPQNAAPKLTMLQASMREKLISARFRHLNETLYTRPSSQAVDLFRENPEMFQEYHEGFRRQVEVWPENPVDGYIEVVRRRGKARFPGRQHGPYGQHAKNLPAATEASLPPLPRTEGTCIIADLGCGDARLAEVLQTSGDAKRLRLKVMSFDLQSPSPLVTRSDIANLPLEDGTVDVAIFCLALMGTNWLDFIEEAYRVLHWKGELWVAEIKSRFGPPGSPGGGKKQCVEHSVGNRKKPGAKKTKGEVAAENEDALAIEVDGAEDRRKETDVSTFVGALQKRGFVLHGDRDIAIDLRNKMFVKMQFIKAASPVTGGGVIASADAGAGVAAQGPPKRRKAYEWPVGKDDSEQNEATILKPCLYKIR